MAEPLVSKGGTTFKRQPDGSYLAGGVNPNSEVYTFVSTSPIEEPRSLRIEALAHPSMKRGGPGRAGNGNIGLSQLKVSAGTTALKLANPRATFNQSDSLHVNLVIDGNPKSGWAVDPQFGKDHAAVFEITNPEIVKGANKRLSIKLHFNLNTQHNIGRLRVSVSNRPAANLPLREGQADPGEVARRELLTLDRKTKGAAQDADLAHMIDGLPQWFGHHDHARSAAVGAIVHRAVAVRREITRVRHLHVDLAVLDGATDDAAAQVALEELGEERDLLKVATRLKRSLEPELARRCAELHELRFRARSRFNKEVPMYMTASSLSRARSPPSRELLSDGHPGHISIPPRQFRY